MLFRTAGVSPAHDHEAGETPAVHMTMIMSMSERDARGSEDNDAR